MTTSTKDDRELDAREIDRRVAESVFGLEVYLSEPFPVAWKWLDRSKSWREEGNREVTRMSTPYYAIAGTNDKPVLRYSTDIASAMQVEDRIAELNLKASYAIALHGIIRETYAPLYIMTDTDETWDLIHATPRQRCQAALAALETVNSEG